MKKSFPWRVVLQLVVVLATTLAFTGMRHRPTGGLEGDEIRWKSGERLTWDNFTGRPDRSSSADALTESGITFNWKCDWRGFELEAYAIFVPSGSWVKEPTRNLLIHEQLHFDITELHARKLRKFFAEHPDPCRLGKAGIDKAAQAIIQQSYNMQNEYDTETRHGEDYRAQKLWIDRVNTELEATAAYAE